MVGTTRSLNTTTSVRDRKKSTMDTAMATAVMIAAVVANESSCEERGRWWGGSVRFLLGRRKDRRFGE